MSAINAIALGTQLHFVDDLVFFRVFFGVSCGVFIISSFIALATHLEE
jgi:hypothetical protein